MNLQATLLTLAIRFANPAGSPAFVDESIYDGVERYDEIARDIAAAAGEDQQLALLMLAYAIGESRLARDADTGPCYRKPPYQSRCDGGLAASIWQMHAHQGYPTAGIFADRARTAERVAALLRGSLSRCRHLSPEDRLSGFGLGHCRTGHEQVRRRYRLWLTLLAEVAQ